MGVQWVQWYNDVVPVVANGCVEDRKNRRVFIVLAKPLFVDTIHERMMKRKDWVIRCWGYVSHGSADDDVNLVVQGVNVGQTISSLGTGVAFKDVFEIAAWLFAVRWQVEGFKAESKIDFVFAWKSHCVSLSLCFVVLFLLRRTLQSGLLNCRITHCQEVIGLFCSTNDVPIFKIFAFYHAVFLLCHAK